MHSTVFPPAIIERLLRRRGRVHAFERIDPKKTALVVIDMQTGFCKPGAPAEIPFTREIVPHINRLVRETRASGGIVAWTLMTIPGKADWPVFLDTLVSDAFADAVVHDLKPGSEGQKLWGEMDVADGDIVVTKNRFSAFMPSVCELHALLQARGIDTVLIVGTVTNVCCETSARDAAIMDYKVIMVSDANACRSDEEQMATLTTFITSFGDVQTTEQVIGLLRGDQAKMQTAAE